MTSFKANQQYKPTEEIVQQLSLEKKLFDEEIEKFTMVFDTTDDI